MKLFYASSISYPSLYANRLQMLHTAAALAARLGDDFILGARDVKPNPIYSGTLINSNARRSPVLGWMHMRAIARLGATHVYVREERLVFFIMLYNALWFRRGLVFVYEAHDTRHLASFRLAYVLRRSAHIFCTNPWVLHAFAERFPKIPGTLLPNGVDLATFMIDEEKEEARRALDLPLHSRLAIYTGRFTTFGNDKGLELALEALREPELASVDLVAVGGSEEDMRRYENLAETLGVAARVILRGATDQATLARYQRAADCLLMYFPNRFHYGEYMSPIKMFEYMASGRPIVASDLPSIRSVLTDATALLLPPDDAKVLASGIAALYRDSVQAEARASRAREAVRSYSWDERAKTICVTLEGLSL